MTEPWNPHDAIERDRDRQRRDRERRQEENQREEQWRRAWGEACSTPDVVTFLQLGRVLRERRCGFWLDYHEIFLARMKHVLEQGLVPGKVLAKSSFGYQVIALCLFKASFFANESAVTNEVREAKRHDTFKGTCESIGELRESFELWMRGVPSGDALHES